MKETIRVDFTCIPFDSLVGPVYISSIPNSRQFHKNYDLAILLRYIVYNLQHRAHAGDILALILVLKF